MNEDEEPPREKTTSAQWALVTLIVSIASASFLYRALVIHRLEQTAALFIGIPSLLAVLLTLTPKQKTVWGSVLRGTAIFLLLSGPILGEGFICILMASPIFFFIAALYAWGASRFEKDRKRMTRCFVLFAIPMCLEGVFPQWTFDRLQSVAVTRTINVNVANVERALQCSPNVTQPLPIFLRIGFPVPLGAEGCGLAVGSLRTIHFSGAEGKPPGDVVMRATESRPGFASFTIVSDSTKLSHWMEWERSDAEWRAIDANHTEVTWRIVFERRLDPAWYFTPLERAAVHEAARYMIQANATPGVEREVK